MQFFGAIEFWLNAKNSDANSSPNPRANENDHTKNKETRRPPPAPATPGQFLLAQAVTNEALTPYLCVFLNDVSVLDVLDIESVQISLYELRYLREYDISSFRAVLSFKSASLSPKHRKICKSDHFWHSFGDLHS